VHTAATFLLSSCWRRCRYRLVATDPRRAFRHGGTVAKGTYLKAVPCSMPPQLGGSTAQLTVADAFPLSWTQREAWTDPIHSSAWSQSQPYRPSVPCPALANHLQPSAERRFQASKAEPQLDLPWRRRVRARRRGHAAWTGPGSTTSRLYCPRYD